MSALLGAVAAALLVFGHHQLSQARRETRPPAPSPLATPAANAAAAPREEGAPQADAAIDWLAVGPWGAVAFTLTTVLTFGIGRLRADRRDAPGRAR